MSIANAIAIGAVSGLRSLTGPAVVAECASRNLLRLKRTPLNWLSSDRAARTTAILAVGEMIADKIPGVPDRTKLGPLAARGISGALCAVALAEHGTGFCRRASTKKVVLSALAGFAGAIAASYIGIRYREHVHLNPVAAALLEDAVAVAAGAFAVTTLET